MKAIEECYKAYAGKRVVDLSTALALAEECMAKKEFLAMEDNVRKLYDCIEQRAFAAGFRLATRLWAEGLRE